MAAYNSEETIGETISSILSQTIKDFELIIVNDKSTDNTEKIIKSFKDKRIKLINNKKNIGLPSNLNKAIKVAKGKYIARMDADDIMLPERLETQLNFMEHNDYDIISGRAIKMDWNGKEIGFMGEAMNNEEIQVSLLFGCPLVHPTIFGKTAVLKKNKYNPEFIKAQDYELWTRIKNKTKFFTIPELLIKYRLGKESNEQKKREITTKFVEKIFARNKTSKENFFTIFEKYGIIGLARYVKIKTYKTFFVKERQINNSKNYFFMQ